MIIPVFITSIVYRKYSAALVLFIIAAITDLLDGLLARMTGQKTALGTFLDPLADKFLLVSSFILFSAYGWVPLWLTIIVISRDLIVVIGWMLLYMITNRADINTVFSGKTAIALQLITIAFVILDLNLPEFVPELGLLFIATASITIISGIQYILKGLKLANAI